jgi:hypothetical protein
VIEALKKTGLAFLDPGNPAAVRNEGRNIEINLVYPREDDAEAGLRPVIKLEFTFCQLQTDTVDCHIRSFAAEAHKEEPEIPGIPCSSLAETAAEKVVSLTRRVASHLEKPEREGFDPALIRHLYDLAKLYEKVDLDHVATLAIEVVKTDAIQFKQQYPGYAKDPATGTQNALKALATVPKFREQYKSFQANMVYGEQIDYDEALAITAEFAAKI